MKDILLVTVFLFSGFLVAHAADDGPMTFEMLKKGKDIVEENCIDCHELDWPMKKITDRAGWEKILTMMANTGAVLDEEDRRLVLEYLLHDIDRLTDRVGLTAHLGQGGRIL